MSAIRATSGADSVSYYGWAHAPIELVGEHRFDGQLLFEVGRRRRIWDAIKEP